jgi:hypothetical protein
VLSPREVSPSGNGAPTAGIAGRTLPHSAEAEKEVIGACLIDEGETLTKCLDARLTPAAFYDCANRLIFEKLCELRRRNLPIAVGSLFEELRAGRQLEAVGGMPYLLQVSARIPTTAQAAYFIEQVRSLYLRRQIIVTAADTAERCFDCKGGDSPADLLGALDALKADAAFASVTLTARLDAARLNPDAEPPELRTVYALKGVPIATPGNVAAICAQAKAGKTAEVGAMLGAVMANGRDGDFLGVSASNPQGWAVVHFDTEQSPRDHWQVVQTALKRADLKTAPPWLMSYSLAGWPIADRRLALEHVLEMAKRECGGVHSLILDGVADFVLDPNDSEEAFPFVDSLQALAIKFDCPVIAVLHLNPGSQEKSRGHLGSQLERRAETNLLLEKDKDTGRTVVFSTKQRRAPILKADGPCFRWDDKEQMHVSVETMRTERDAAAMEGARELAAEVFTGHGGLTYSAITSSLKAATKCSESTAHRRFTEMRSYKIIARHPPNLWVLAA